MGATPRRLSPRTTFYLLASLTVSYLAGSLAPTPLYPVYQAEWGFSALRVTEIFGIYALALLGALLVAGRLSDYTGRRPVLIAATLTQAAVMVMFATARDVDALLLARLIQGIATGSAIGAVGAGMVDLDKARGPAFNAIAPMTGTGLGGLLAGLVVHFLPDPTLLIYLLLGVIFLLQTLGVVLMVETASRHPGALASLMPQASVPAAARRSMLLAAPVLVAAWSLAGFYASLGPALMHRVYGWNPSLAGGMAAFILAGGGAVSVMVLQRRDPRAIMILGASALMAGTIVAMLSLSHRSPAGFLLGTLAAGIGFGSGFQGAVRTVVPFAKPNERAGLLSVIFVVSYLAMGIPAMVAGFFVARHGNLLAASQHFSIMVIALAAFALLGMMVGGRRQA